MHFHVSCSPHEVEVDASGGHLGARADREACCSAPCVFGETLTIPQRIHEQEAKYELSYWSHT